MELFDVIADPSRRRILELITDRERSAGEIAAAFDVSRPAVSRHLRVLREAGLVRCRSDAQRRLYRLDAAALASVEQWLNDCSPRSEAMPAGRAEPAFPPLQAARPATRTAPHGTPPSERHRPRPWRPGTPPGPLPARRAPPAGESDRL